MNRVLAAALLSVLTVTASAGLASAATMTAGSSASVASLSKARPVVTPKAVTHKKKAAHTTAGAMTKAHEAAKPVAVPGATR